MRPAIIALIILIVLALTAVLMWSMLAERGGAPARKPVVPPVAPTAPAPVTRSNACNSPSGFAMEYTATRQPDGAVRAELTLRFDGEVKPPQQVEAAIDDPGFDRPFVGAPAGVLRWAWTWPNVPATATIGFRVTDADGGKSDTGLQSLRFSDAP